MSQPEESARPVFFALAAEDLEVGVDTPRPHRERDACRCSEEEARDVEGVLPMDDGVDTLFDEDGKAMSPGTPGFIETWAESLNSDEQSTLEAYFPEHQED